MLIIYNINYIIIIIINITVVSIALLGEQRSGNPEEAILNHVLVNFCSKL